ncbi:serine/threonine-protein kinase [Actinoplanes friuliensis]|uniref:non-specific serine/threonine protein kinase n=1 Tax=Actinoplanes friuliensis DSM 7358 TaxID=1246995 RepID=U5W1A8_9ACTN|nr:serine/threonine-protein kinase [Actinoplanes friuliensis]AGZ41681.1 serine/threonine protein kinase [Actinoplanes friuliensis DSM 7358]
MVTSPARIGSYRIERLLGIGSFATVWLGHDTVLGAHVAIKVLAENWSHDLRVRERFLDEARLLWRLDDERVVRVHALGELPDGRPYLVMGWAEGGSLRDRLAGDPIPAGPALTLLREICKGVAVLHDQGIVHRDLTPGNILFSGGRAVIADLGLAKALAAASGLTARAGTPGYMAPEQDDPLAIIDRRADVYGLGRLGLRLLPAPPPKIAEVLRTATARRPENRYPDASALGAALDRATIGRSRASPLALAAGRGVLGLASAVLLVALASDSIGDRLPPRPGTVVDAAGRLSLPVPAGWTARSGHWTRPGPVVVISPDPARWTTDTTVPGAFAWLWADAATTPSQFVAERPNQGCRPLPVRTLRAAGLDWYIAAFRACPDGRAEIVEAVGTRPGDPGLVYVQIAPPPDSPAFTDTLLAGVRAR